MCLVLFTSGSPSEGTIPSGRGSSLLSKSFLKTPFTDLPKDSRPRGLQIKVKLTGLISKLVWMDVDFNRCMVRRTTQSLHRPYHLLLISEDESRQCSSFALFILEWGQVVTLIGFAFSDMINDKTAFEKKNVVQHRAHGILSVTDRKACLWEWSPATGVSITFPVEADKRLFSQTVARLEP